jgi:uncharacterized membrane protein
MFYYVKLYIATLIVFFAVDLLWIGIAARAFYRKHIGFLLAPSPNWAAAIIFYLLFIMGLLFFVVLPGLKENSLKIIILRAALFGLITYSTYDLTNQATVNNWPLVVTVVDMIWGMVLSVAVSLLSFIIGKWLG